MQLTTKQKLNYKRALARGKVIKYETLQLIKKLESGSGFADLIRQYQILNRAANNFIRRNIT